MTDEYTRLTDAELADAIDMGDESWFWPEGGEKATTLDVLLDLRRTRHERDHAQRLGASLYWDTVRERDALRAALNPVTRSLAPAELFDAVYDAMYGGINAGAEERESVAQLCEALSPLLRAATVSPASESELIHQTADGTYRHDGCSGYVIFDADGWRCGECGGAPSAPTKVVQ